MYKSNITFSNIEQERRVFKLFYQVLNGEKSLEEMSVEELKKELPIEDIAVFFELMAKYLDSKKLKEEKEEKEGKTK